jgi:hypothetical protein
MLIILYLIYVLLDYINQDARFEVEEGFGCINATAAGDINLLLTRSWPIVLPLVSTLFYCRKSFHPRGSISYSQIKPKLSTFFYRHSRETNEFFQSNGSINRPGYFRILALACIDILLTLPLGVISATIDLLSEIHEASPGSPFQFYSGWANVHSDGDPVAFSYEEIVGDGVWEVLYFFFINWTSPILAIAVFALFGCTSEARVTYWRVFFLPWQRT